MRKGEMRRAVAAVLMTVGVVTATLVELPAGAGPNRCGTEPPERSPTWVDGAGSHWFDQHGLWTQGPDGGQFGGAGIDFDERNIQVDPWANHSYQIYISQEEQCAVAGDVRQFAPDIGEFPILPAPSIVSMPWLSRDGNLVRGDDGRSTILRGVDWPYNQEIFEGPYNVTDDDFERIASWGLNALRVRITSARSGYLPGTTAEPGYWENLDQIIAKANSHGIYVIPATVTADVESGHFNADHERLKFIPGTPNRAHWLNFQASVFERYRDWPGVVGFDTMNEDNSYPPYLHDRLFMGPAHQAANDLLRTEDDDHIYFQEPSGWSYWGAEYWPGMMQGNDIGDDNRYYCPKYRVTSGSTVAQDLDLKATLATQSGVPMFLCELWIDKDVDEPTLLTKQREVLNVMDARLMGGMRVLYGPSAGYGALNHDGTEAFWVQEFARPYPKWVGGDITAVSHDFDAQKLTLTVSLDSSGTTQIFVPQARMYTDGFEADASTGAHLEHDGAAVLSGASGMTWNTATQTLSLPSQTASSVTITIQPPASSLASMSSAPAPAPAPTTTTTALLPINKLL